MKIRQKDPHHPSLLFFSPSYLYSQSSLPDPNSYPVPTPGRYGTATPSLGHSVGPDDSASQVAWAKRQQGPKRGLTRKVKLTRGHWVIDHRVPTAIKNSIEPKWSSGEFGMGGSKRAEWD